MNTSIMSVSENLHTKTATTLEDVHAIVKKCLKCSLGGSRKNVVFGSGNGECGLFIVGEAPGADEDEKGLPFVGKSGKLLTELLRLVQFTRDEVYIANVIKCRPPLNRRPDSKEIASCLPYLKRQIELIKPKVILALGKTAAEALFGKEHPMWVWRERVHQYQEIDVFVTYHPAAVLRNPIWKKGCIEDLEKLRKHSNKIQNSEK